jgi:hypothetical protein
MAIQEVIRAQFDAFKRDDAEAAFRLASPKIQAMSGSPEAFLEMVRNDYAPVYRSRAIFFQDVSIMDGVPAQRVLVMDARGTPYLAVYPMTRLKDGSWRIDGCMLSARDAQML